MLEIAKQPCDICGIHAPNMMGHTEDYDNVYDLRPVCVECHMKLHARFSRAGAWINHLKQVAAGYRCRPWTSVWDYFGNQQDNRYPEYANIDPATLGDKWYHKLLMTKINLNHE